MKIMKNILFTITMLISAQGAMAMQLPKFTSAIESPTLRYLPPRAQDLVLKELSKDNVNQTVKNLIALAQTQKAVRGSLLTVQNICTVLDSLPKTAHVVDVIERLQKMPKAFPMMKDSAITQQLATAKASLKFGQDLHTAVQNNDRPRVKQLLEHPDIDMNFRALEYGVNYGGGVVPGSTPLMGYIKNVDYDKYSQLVGTRRNRSELYHVDVDKGFYSCIPTNEERPITKDSHHFLMGTKFGDLPRAQAVEKDINQLLIEAGANIETPEACGWSPLIRATQKNKIDTVERLLKAGACVKAKGDEKTPLMWATFNGDIELVRKFLEAGSDVHHTSINDTALTLAARNCMGSRDRGENYHIIMGMLLNSGANPDVLGCEGKTPLIQIVVDAIQSLEPCIEQAKTLLLFGNANPDIRDRDGKTAHDHVSDRITYLEKVVLNKQALLKQSPQKAQGITEDLTCIDFCMRNCQELKALLEKVSLERKQNAAAGCAIS